jgi:hypothetical protein
MNDRKIIILGNIILLSYFLSCLLVGIFVQKVGIFLFMVGLPILAVTVGIWGQKHFDKEIPRKSPL